MTESDCCLVTPRKARSASAAQQRASEARKAAEEKAVLRALKSCAKVSILQPEVASKARAAAEAERRAERAGIPACFFGGLVFCDAEPFNL